MFVKAYLSQPSEPSLLGWILCGGHRSDSVPSLYWASKDVWGCNLLGRGPLRRGPWIYVKLTWGTQARRPACWHPCNPISAWAGPQEVHWAELLAVGHKMIRFQKQRFTPPAQLHSRVLCSANHIFSKGLRDNVATVYISRLFAWVCISYMSKTVPPWSLPVPSTLSLAKQSTTCLFFLFVFFL